MRTNNRFKAMLTRRSAAITIAGLAAIHFALASEYLSDTPYIGVLFIAGAVASAYVAVRLWFSRDIVAWTLGGLVAAGMFIGFILSRTIGLPSFHETEWEPSGILSLILEAGYLGGMVWWLRSAARRRRAVDEAFPPLSASAADRTRGPRATTSA
jgi:hypothetical protein